MAKIIVFGSLNMDLSIQYERMPREGETVEGGSFITNPGGKGANQAIAAARLSKQTVAPVKVSGAGEHERPSAPVYMIGSVGDDVFGAEAIRALEASGINTDGIAKTDKVPTGVAVIMRKESDNRIILGHGANWSLTPSEGVAALRAVAKPHDVFLTQFECAAETTEAMLKEAHELGLYTMLNPAPVRSFKESLWADIDYVCINETEADAITGILPTNQEEAHAAAQTMQSMGVADVVVTLGSAGAYGLHGQANHFEPARKVVAVDTTAAGDTYIGAMAASHILGMSFNDAMGFAASASALTVSRLGSLSSIPWRQEIA